MKYIHRYHDLESFIKDYNDDPNVMYIVVSGITLNFEQYYDDGSNCCDWGNEDGYYAETYVGRNPSVGDEVDFAAPGEDYITLTIEEVDDQESKYIEPWVSFCDEEGIYEFSMTCSDSQSPGSQYEYGARFVGEEDGFYKWESFQIPGKDAPGYDYYWTTTLDLHHNDGVFCSLNGARQNNPCAYVYEILKTIKKVNYNKKSNWIKIGYSAGSSDAYLEIDDWGSGFDNSENSEYYVYCDNTGEETMYQGVSLYWDRYYDLYIDDIPCYRYYFIESDGAGGWRIGSGTMSC